METIMEDKLALLVNEAALPEERAAAWRNLAEACAQARQSGKEEDLFSAAKICRVAVRVPDDIVPRAETLSTLLGVADLLFRQISGKELAMAVKLYGDALAHGTGHLSRFNHEAIFSKLHRAGKDLCVIRTPASLVFAEKAFKKIIEAAPDEQEKAKVEAGRALRRVALSRPLRGFGGKSMRATVRILLQDGTAALDPDPSEAASAATLTGEAMSLLVTQAQTTDDLERAGKLFARYGLSFHRVPSDSELVSMAMLAGRLNQNECGPQGHALYKKIRDRGLTDAGRILSDPHVVAQQCEEAFVEGVRLPRLPSQKASMASSAPMFRV